VVPFSNFLLQEWNKSCCRPFLFHSLQPIAQAYLSFPHFPKFLRSTPASVLKGSVPAISTVSEELQELERHLRHQVIRTAVLVQAEDVNDRFP